jgi:hypothetical protein
VLECALPSQEESEAFKKLESLLNKRINSALSGAISNKTLDEIFDEELADQ